ncbi:MAG: hypothetical protein EBY16_03265 [Gammaproteobacteria bacterium]|nr:hypothetical protein [Gammaproteobacteria bacterium]
MIGILKAGIVLVLCLGLQAELMAQTELPKHKKKVKYTCLQKCFSHCKFKNEAVDDCQITNATTVSFRVICACRPLKKGEILPAFFHNSRIIKTSAS